MRHHKVWSIAGPRLGPLLLVAGVALGQSGYKPAVPNLRITDIQSIAGDPEGDRFQIMFEFVNWTNAPVTSIALVANIGSTMDSGGIDAKVRIVSAGAKSTGRPIFHTDVNGDGVINVSVPASNALSDLEDLNLNGVLDPGEDKNNNGRLDNDPLPARPFQNSNDWRVTSLTSTSAEWSGGTPIPPRDLASQPGAEARCRLIPGCVLSGVYVSVAHPEMVDNGSHALDGFVVEMDGWEPGEVLSLDWFLLNGEAAVANPYAAGLVSLLRETLPFGGPLPPGLFSQDSPFFQKDGLHHFFGGVFRDPPPLPQDRWFSVSLGHNPTTPIKPGQIPAGVEVKGPQRDPNGLGPGVAFPELVRLVYFAGKLVPGDNTLYKIVASFQNVTAQVAPPGWNLGRLCFVPDLNKTSTPPLLQRGPKGEVLLFGGLWKEWVCNGAEIFRQGAILQQEFLVKLGNKQPFNFFVDAYDGNADENNLITLAPPARLLPVNEATAAHVTLGRNQGPFANVAVTLRGYDPKTNRQSFVQTLQTNAAGRATFNLNGRPDGTTLYLRAEYNPLKSLTPVRRYSNVSVLTWKKPEPVQKAREKAADSPTDIREF